ncbi:MAG: phosphotransferase [Rhodospirillales bacterium]
MTVREAARNLFLTDGGWENAAINWLAGDASFRRYARLNQAGKTAMLMDAPPAKESVGAFLRVAKILSEAGITTPQVLRADQNNGFLLLEDFGDDTFTRVLNRGENAAALYDMAVDSLIQMRREIVQQPSEIPDYLPSTRAEHLSIVLDWLWPEILPTKPTVMQRNEFIDLWRNALVKAPTLGTGLVHRDFHVDNLMLLGDGTCGVLDFQDAAWGPLAYDLASLIEDARRPLEPAIRTRCIDRYREAFPELEENEIIDAIAVHGGQRHMRVVALWVRLWRRDGKSKYLRHMRHTWNLLEASLCHPILAEVRAFLTKHMPNEAREQAIMLGDTVT